MTSCFSQQSKSNSTLFVTTYIQVSSKSLRVLCLCFSRLVIPFYHSIYSENNLIFLSHLKSTIPFTPSEQSYLLFPDGCVTDWLTDWLDKSSSSPMSYAHFVMDFKCQMESALFSLLFLVLSGNFDICHAMYTHGSMKCGKHLAVFHRVSINQARGVIIVSYFVRGRVSKRVIVEHLWTI